MYSSNQNGLKKDSIKHYRILDKIGKGSFSTVYSGYDTLKKESVAIKKIKLQGLKPRLLQYFENEIEIMKSCDHVNIIRLYDVIHSKKYIFLILEYCSKGDLSKHLHHKKHDEDTVRKYMKHLCNGLLYLQKKNIIHRDLKPQNILIHEDGILKIIDFGFAKYSMQEDLSTTMCGSPLYMAPEILYNKEYSKKADLWSLGIIMFEMITGYPPFKAHSLQELISLMKDNPIPLISNISPEGQQLLCDLLQKEEINRIDWTDIKNHCWFHPELNLEFDEIFEMDFSDNNYKSSNSIIDSIASSFNSITNNISTTTSTSTSMTINTDIKKDTNISKGEKSISSNNSEFLTETNNDFIMIPTIEKIPPEKPVPNSWNQSLSYSYKKLRNSINFIAGSL